MVGERGDRQTDRQTESDRESDSQTESQTNGLIDRQIDRTKVRHRQADMYMEIQTDAHTKSGYLGCSFGSLGALRDVPGVTNRHCTTSGG
mgnify:CR=1 FL=1